VLIVSEPGRAQQLTTSHAHRKAPLLVGIDVIAGRKLRRLLRRPTTTKVLSDDTLCGEPVTRPEMPLPPLDPAWQAIEQDDVSHKSVRLTQTFRLASLAHTICLPPVAKGLELRCICGNNGDANDPFCPPRLGFIPFRLPDTD